jgi:hypothetical protein
MDLVMLPKGKKMRPLVSEFQVYCKFLSEQRWNLNATVSSNSNPKAPEWYIDSYSGENSGRWYNSFLANGDKRNGAR